jgi:NAD(P)-dependent dehydrogenase (short-subunit alcohol dehydrogenase family)
MKYTAWLNQHIANLKGKIVLITGANSGLGFYASKQLAYRGAHVLMACRNLKTAEEAKKLILLDVPNANLTIIPFDQSSFESIRSFVSHMKVAHPRIDILLLNAGIIMPIKGAKTVDGLPLTTGVNFFNVYYLLREWLGYLDQRNPDIRLVFVGSYSAYQARMTSMQSLLNHQLPRMNQYRLSKLAIAMLHHVFQMNLNLFDFPVIDHVSAILVHPGLASTNIVRDLPRWLQTLIKGLLSLITHSAESGALSLTYACGHPYITNGQYIGPNGPGESFGYPTKLKLKPHFAKGSAKFTYEVGKYLETIGGKSHVGSR